MVTVLDIDLEGKAMHCSYCFREIEKARAVIPSSDRLSAAYCSQECHVSANTQFQDLLFAARPPLAPEGAAELPAELKAERAKAQEAFVAHIKKAGNAAPLLAARLIARQITAEILKMVSGVSLPQLDLPVAGSKDYALNDHVERLRYLELTVPQNETKLLRNVLQTALPGLEAFVTDERHAIVLGKMAYNSYGVCFGGGRDDKVGFLTEALQIC